MKSQHEQLIVLEERCRRMNQLIKDKKKERKGEGEEKRINEEEIERLQLQVKEAEQEKVSEEKRLKVEVSKQDTRIKSLQHELNLLNLQIKEKD